jgi:hypothetical protein
MFWLAWSATRTAGEKNGEFGSAAVALNGAKGDEGESVAESDVD